MISNCDDCDLVGNNHKGTCEECDDGYVTSLDFKECLDCSNLIDRCNKCSWTDEGAVECDECSCGYIPTKSGRWCHEC